MQLKGRVLKTEVPREMQLKGRVLKNDPLSDALSVAYAEPRVHVPSLGREQWQAASCH
jgi:hypothetical protein